jgi:acyl-coenzyme A thioesterase PaaI-like protein
VNSALERGDRAATLDVQYQTRRSAKAGDALRVLGEVTQLTRQIAYVESVVRSDDDRVVSQATATFLLRRREVEGE